MLSFRQPGDMGRYVADNDPGGIAAGFSNLEDFLAAGNKIPEYKMGGRQPLQAVDAQQSPFDLSKINKNPYGTEFVGIGEDQTNLFGYRVPDEIIKAQEESAKNNPINMFNVSLPGELDLLRNPVRPKSDDPIRQGFFDSEFYKPNAPTTMDVVNYTYQGKPMTGSSSNISQFQQYLDSIGKGDLIQRNDQIFSQETGPLATVSGPNDSLDLFAGRPVLSGDEERISGVGQDIFGNNPAEIPVPSAPQNNQFQGFNDRLTKIEEGVASLLQNRGQQFNFGMQPRFDFGMQPRFNISGLGYFFNPQGGFYG